MDYRFPVYSFLIPPFQAVPDILLGAWDCGARDGLARRIGKDDIVVEGVLGIRRVRWGTQSSCRTGVVYWVFFTTRTHGNGIRFTLPRQS